MMNFELTPIQILNFWKKVSVKGNEDCWNWNACLHYKGYGEFQVGRNHQKAHRVSWNLTFGSIPEGLMVCHKCDNRKCCNPYHLFLGTNEDNMKDMARKGRAWKPKGEKNPSAKLDASKVLRIRNLYEEGFTLIQVAGMFGVGKSIISKIVRKEAWV